MTSLVLGILGFFTCGFTALIGLILGIIALVKVRNSQGALKGNGLALAGVIVSAIFILMIPLFAAMLLPAIAAGKQKAEELSCMTNEKQLALATLMFSASHTNCFPPATNWCDAIQGNLANPGAFRCVVAGDGRRCDYAFNSQLGGIAVTRVAHPAETVLLFESDLGWNGSGGVDAVAGTRHGHGHASIVTFADGHVELVDQSRLNTLRWEP
ncbi:MAG TPA: DUF4190 domain-containing protein [Verrucomicrobiae bacterium]|nr:DUF4190 domain-containing protein [Verrucomicrobiae bacterium]